MITDLENHAASRTGLKLPISVRLSNVTQQTLNASGDSKYQSLKGDPFLHTEKDIYQYLSSRTCIHRNGNS